MEEKWWLLKYEGWVPICARGETEQEVIRDTVDTMKVWGIEAGRLVEIYRINGPNGDRIKE